MADSVPPFRVLVVSCDNDGRSLLVAALLTHDAQGDGVAEAARLVAARRVLPVPPVVVDALAEIDVGLPGVAAPPLTDGALAAATAVVTIDCAEQVPLLAGKRYSHWPLEDPTGRSLQRVRAIRDDARRRVGQLLDDLSAVPDAKAGR